MLKHQPLARISSATTSWSDVMVLLLGLLVLIHGLGGYGLYEPHEGHFGGVAHEMLLRGDWITPHLNGSPYLNKPPLLYWLIATSTTLWGSTEYAARLPLAIIGWLGAIVAWKWARELWNPTAGRLAALMLCSTTGWFVFTHQILIDVLLATLLLATYYCLWRLERAPHCWIYWLSLYSLLGLCVLTKGPVFLGFPLIGCLAIAFRQRSWRLFQQLRIRLGIIVTSLVTLPWFMAVEQANPGFFHYFLFNENLKRIADTRWPPDYEVSKVSAIGYLVVTAIWCLPWIVVLPQALYSAWQDYWPNYSRNYLPRYSPNYSDSSQQPNSYRYTNQNCHPCFETSVGLSDSYWDPKQEGRELGFREASSDQTFTNSRSSGILLLVIAATLPIVAFLPLSSRLVYYSIPSIPPLIILCAGWWSRCQDQKQRQGRIAAAVSFCSLGVISGLVGISARLWNPNWVSKLAELSNYRDFDGIIYAIALWFSSGFLIGGIFLLLKRAKSASVSIFLSFFFVYVTFTHSFTTLQDIRSAKTLIETANPVLGLSTLWTFEGSRELGAAGAMSYYLNQDHRHLAEIGNREQGTGNRGEELTKTVSRQYVCQRSNHKFNQVVLKPGTKEEPKNFPSSLSCPSFDLPAGWAKGKDNTAYRIVLVLTDSGFNRLPPEFPGPKPQYGITKQKLQEYWDSSRPVVFVTDFLGQPGDNLDDLSVSGKSGKVPRADSQHLSDHPATMQHPESNLNLPKHVGEPLLVVEPRKLYGNAAAREIWLASQ
ncbi:MAG: glycosyltransferase family 39 protein [Moorea sp. SIO4E2]|nr:glycosyltransferase family 39 protein [Moorena sp. SIO4E2]NEQ08882.1 glycosyltransferase family 39 protein [Moorena sp. SIO4E2]